MPVEIIKILNRVTRTFHNSTIYAIGRINNSYYGFCKILWFLAFLACLTGSVYKVNSFYKLYLQFPVVENLEITERQSLKFPAVSICNLNRMKNIKSRLCFAKADEGKGRHGTPLIFSERRSLHNCEREKKNEDNFDFRKILALNFLKSYYNLSDEERYNMGHLPVKFVSGCSFNGKSCNESDKVSFFTFRYGNCITFNKQSNLYTSETGVGSGLNLKLSLECYCYLPTTDIFGIRIAIHDPNEIPNLEEEGFNLSPGFETSISVKKTIKNRLPAPYKDRCVDYRKRNSNYPKSKSDCIRKCIQEKNFVKCGCVDPTLAVMRHFGACDITNETQSCCLDDVLNDMSTYGPSCNCPLPCNSVDYKSVLSKSLLPKGNTSIEKSLLNLHGGKCILRKENLRLNIFYSSLEEPEYHQSPKWEIQELLGFLGNTFGLWLGLSLMIIVEAIEKLAMLVIYVYSTFLSRT